MSNINCDNITSMKRSLPKGAKLLMGDQLIEGCAIKVTLSKTLPARSDDVIMKDRLASEIYGIDADDLVNGESLNPVGTKIYAVTFITEAGFEICSDSAVVIHSGYGGEVRIFAAGSSLNQGDILVNGTAVSSDGSIIFAPARINTSGFNVGSEGAIISPGGGDDDEAFCSLQELFGKGSPKESKLRDLIPELDIDYDIPSLDMTWWVPIQEKINEVSALQSKFMAKTQNLVRLVEVDEDEACKYVPDARKLMELLAEAQLILAKIKKLVQAIRTLIQTIKKVIKLIEFLFGVLKAVQPYVFLKQVISGVEIMLDVMYKNITNTSVMIPQLIAVLQGILAKCAFNRGMDAGLSKSECEALGGVYMDRRKGDLGSSDGSGVLPGRIPGRILEDLSIGIDDDDILYLRPGLTLNEGDKVFEGSVIDSDGNIFTGTQNTPYTIPAEGYTVDSAGASGNSENAVISGEEFQALLNDQILDLSNCMVRIDDFEKVNNFSE
jgi:hypothetical protein